eukprot:10863926-Lingulodinium_polyedra.AAC.1
MLSSSSGTIFLVHTLQIADGLCNANLVDGAVVDDIVDADTVVDGHADVGKDCERALCATMDEHH